MTRYDKIKAMNEKELAILLCKLIDECNIKCGDCVLYDCIDCRSVDSIEKWLREEAK